MKAIKKHIKEIVAIVMIPVTAFALGLICACLAELFMWGWNLIN